VPMGRGLDALNDPLRDALENSYVACFCLLSTKLFLCRPERRTQEEIMDILEELNHLKAYAHLSTSVRRELAALVTFEVVATAGDVCTFSMGLSRPPFA